MQPPGEPPGATDPSGAPAALPATVVWNGPAGDRPPLVLLHGFTQNASGWGPFAENLPRALEPGRALVFCDLPGRGRAASSSAGPEQAAPAVLAAAVLAAENQVPILARSPVDLLGYSLGARFALATALAFPERVRRMVLLSATAGIEDPQAAARRRAQDEELAARLEASGDVAGFLEGWLAKPMFFGIPPEGAARDARASNSAAGLARSLRGAGVGRFPAAWERLGGLLVRTLVVAGADDPRYVVAGARLVRGLPAGTFTVVPGAGHAVHLHQPALVARLVARFLDAP